MSVEIAAAEAAAACAWSDFLSNRVRLAVVRAAPFARQLSELLDERDVPAELLVVLADMAYITGAGSGDDPEILALALVAYERFIKLEPPEATINAMRMRAETLLRLRRYAEAFEAFNTLHAARLRHFVLDDAEVAPFRLIHDAEALEAAARLGLPDSDDSTAACDLAHRWRQLADELAAVGHGGMSSDALWQGEDTGQTMAADSTNSTAAPSATLLDTLSMDLRHRVRVRSLSPSQRVLLGLSYGSPLPIPLGTARHWEPGMSVLHARTDWSVHEARYHSDRCVVIDGILGEGALKELQQYARHGAHFNTMRNGYLGCFPNDGATHPILLKLTTELTRVMRGVFEPYALALWWFFKYSDAGNAGIGLHADPAAVNVNIWLTEDDAQLSGGGLLIYDHVPPLEQPTVAANHEFASVAAEDTLRRKLLAKVAHGDTNGDHVQTRGARQVPYACNRAVIFVSDQYHESEPFKFKPGYENRRCNLTLLFGDRWSLPTPGNDVAPRLASSAASGEQKRHSQAGSTQSTGACSAGSADGWDVFD